MGINKEYTFNFKEYASIGDLPSEYQTLVNKAVDAQKSSYSPYSNFAVGASVLLANGEILQGSNQENGAFPSGMCAERVALFYAGSKYPGVAVKAIAISASFKGAGPLEPISPCGACRQVMLETRNIGNTPMEVIMVGERRIYVIDDVTLMLPFSFSKVDEAIKG